MVSEENSWMRSNEILLVYSTSCNLAPCKSTKNSRLAGTEWLVSAYPRIATHKPAILVCVQYVYIYIYKYYTYISANIHV